jgi:hypothetical protein
MASVKPFLVEPLLFAVGMGGWGGGGGEGMLSPCEAQSKQQQNENILNGGRKNIKSLCLTNFQLLSVRKNTGRKKLFIYIYIYI